MDLGQVKAGRVGWSMADATGMSWSLSAVERQSDTVIDLLEDRVVQNDRESRSLCVPLCQLSQAQSQLSDALTLARNRLRRNSDRMERTTVEASEAGHRILRSELAALGFGEHIPASPRRGTSVRSFNHSLRGTPVHFQNRNPEEVALTLQRADAAKRRIREQVAAESHCCALLRAEVAGEIELLSNSFQQWMEFFKSAVQVTQGHQRHEVEQILRFLHARREERESNAQAVRERSRMMLEIMQAEHNISLQRRQATLSEELGRKRCATEAEMAARQMALNELAEAHQFDLGTSKIELEQRRNDQAFITSLVSQGIRVFKGGL